MEVKILLQCRNLGFNLKMSMRSASAMGPMLSVDIIVDIKMFQDSYIFDISSESSFLAANLGKELVRRGLRRLTRITCLDPGKIVRRRI